MNRKYVDGYVIPVPKNKVAQYKKIAQQAAKVWMKYGALDYYEAVGDDLNIKGVVSFAKLARAKPNETIIFAWITYKSRAQRDRINKKVMEDPWMKEFDPGTCPFDVKRLAFSGFKIIVAGKKTSST